MCTLDYNKFPDDKHFLEAREITLNDVTYKYWVMVDIETKEETIASSDYQTIIALKKLSDDNSDLQKANAQNMLSSVQRQQLNANLMQQNAQLKTNINQQNQLISQLMLEIATLKGGNK